MCCIRLHSFRTMFIHILNKYCMTAQLKYVRDNKVLCKNVNIVVLFCVCVCVVVYKSRVNFVIIYKLYSCARFPRIHCIATIYTSYTFNCCWRMRERQSFLIFPWKIKCAALRRTARPIQCNDTKMYYKYVYNNILLGGV